MLHLDIRIKPLGHGMGNNGLAFFFQQCNELFLLGNEGVNFGGFVIKKISNSNLLNMRWLCDFKVSYLTFI
jgi:hypothetical protein